MLKEFDMLIKILNFFEIVDVEVVGESIEGEGG